MLNVLIVDDDKSLTSMIHAVFEEFHNSYTTQIAHNTKKALEILQERKIDICLLDIKLERENSLEKIQDFSTFKDTLFVIYSHYCENYEQEILTYTNKFKNISALTKGLDFVKDIQKIHKLREMFLRTQMLKIAEEVKKTEYYKEISTMFLDGVELLNDPVCVIDLVSGEIMRCNSAFARFFETEQSTFEGQHFIRFIHEKDLNKVTQTVKNRTSGLHQNVHRNTWRVKGKDFKVAWNYMNSMSAQYCFCIVFLQEKLSDFYEC